VGNVEMWEMGIRELGIGNGERDGDVKMWEMRKWGIGNLELGKE
jgi:hypothetical protein